jgi:L-amino acid N-acyltransferase YncA
VDYRFRPLEPGDRDAFLGVFNYFVESSFAAWPDQPAGAEFFDRILAITAGYPSLAIEEEAGGMAGFAFLRPFHPAGTLRRTAEITYFLLPGHTGQGLGRRVLATLIEQARGMGIDNLLASVSSRNEQSLRFHEKAGFTCCGRLRAAGRKFAEDFDVVWFQKAI